MLFRLCLLAVVWLSLCRASDLDIRTSNRDVSVGCSNDDPSLGFLKQSVARPGEWCWFWNSTSHAESPFASMSISTMTAVCDCILENPTLIGQEWTFNEKKGDYSDVSVIYINRMMAWPLVPDFCQWWRQAERKGSPFKILSRATISTICRKAAAAPSYLDPIGSSTSTATTTSAASAAATTSAGAFEYFSAKENQHTHSWFQSGDWTRFKDSTALDGDYVL